MLVLLLLFVACYTAEKPRGAAFLKWCQQGEAAPKDIQYTINAMKNEMVSSSCQETWDRLSQRAALDLVHLGIRDLKPLADLTQLRILRLDSNKITNLEPLHAIDGLWELSLSDNPVESLGPLGKMTKLQKLNLHGTRVSSLAPLVGLTELRKLQVSQFPLDKKFRTKALPLAPLAGLTNLEELWISYEQLKDIRPLAGLTKLKILLDSGAILHAGSNAVGENAHKNYGMQMKCHNIQQQQTMQL